MFGVLGILGTLAAKPVVLEPSQGFEELQHMSIMEEVVPETHPKNKIVTLQHVQL